VGFEGDNCQIDVDDCAAQICSGNGSCKDGANSYICECIKGYEGTDCQNHAGMTSVYIPPLSTSSAISTPDATSADVTTLVTSTVDSKHIGVAKDCLESEDPCTEACQPDGSRNYRVTQLATDGGAPCAGPTDCKGGAGACKSWNDLVSTTDAPPKSKAERKKKVGGLVVGLVLAALVVAVCLVVFFRKKEHTTRTSIPVVVAGHVNPVYGDSKPRSAAPCQLHPNPMYNAGPHQNGIAASVNPANNDEYLVVQCNNQSSTQSPSVIFVVPTDDDHKDPMQPGSGRFVANGVYDMGMDGGQPSTQPPAAGDGATRPGGVVANGVYAHGEDC
jgi:hypothetical protein